MSNFMIYGATGYTGRMASEYAKSLGMGLVVAGRDSSSIDRLSSSLGVPARVFDLHDTQLVDSCLKGICILLNCAGPFSRTAEPLIKACIRCGIHYLDISAELVSYQFAINQDEQAKRAEIMLLPGCGGSVAMLGCLAGHVYKQMEEEAADRIDIALRVSGPMSRGSAISAAEGLTPTCLQCRDGELTQQNAQEMVRFDFDDGNGDVSCFPVTLPDLITIRKSTGILNIRTFVSVAGDAFQSGDLGSLPDGPTVEQRKANPYHASVVLTSRGGTAKRAVLHTVNGYEFTPIASVEAARRILGGRAIEGFQTPAALFGNDFVMSIPGSSLRLL
ncbi:Saccharopine dehydrogenase-domain-containing protein [Xylariales sp. PMI_506]|nr:Saccharopine dehydrogenase-domain-containing protein [Xylariales sp. PMI_506]